jgi:UDP-N-acetylglucosamine 1-carboxyvinyltransferase
MTITARPSLRVSEPAAHAGERTYRVFGARPLQGTVTVRGAKNAMLPIMAATLLTQDPCVVENVPDIVDIHVMMRVLEHLGAHVALESQGHLKVEAADIRSRTTPEDLATQLRGSFLVMGPLLARFGQASAPRPGGCRIGARPVDVPVRGFGQLGAQVAVVDERFSASGRLHGTDLVLDYPSQTGTENLIMAATLADGITIIENASTEPEVLDLVGFLQAMGARIAWTGPGTVAIQGVTRLHGAAYRVMPDRLEAATYLLAGAATGGDVTVARVVPRHMRAVLAKLAEAGATVDEGEHTVRLRVPQPLQAVDVHTYPYPGFPTDIQQPFGAMLTQAVGESMIQETMYEDRLRYAGELVRMGATIHVRGQTAIIRGPTPLRGAEVRALDLRAGAAVLIAGLAAEGETVVRQAQLIERGYTDIAANLAALGAECCADTSAGGSP